MSATGAVLARASSDADDRLLAADEPLAGLQHRCGGTIPGTIAIPALLELVRKARLLSLSLARPVQALDGDEQVTAWVEVTPDLSTGGCTIALANWQASPANFPGDDALASQALAIERQLAELTAWLDPSQNLLAYEASAHDLTAVGEAMANGIGKPWTDFVSIAGDSHRQPLHWRLLDGAQVSLAGSERIWTARLVPLGQPQAGSEGFELYLVPDRPLPAAQPGPKRPPAVGNAVGRELVPFLRPHVSRIVANAETIRARMAGPLPDEYSDYAGDIATAGQHLLSLIEDLADIEAVEEEQAAASSDRIDLGDVARKTADILGARARERRIKLVVPQAGEHLLAIGEFRRALQVLLNITGNAIRYSPEDSQVWIRLGEEDGHACVTVADQGPGLSEDQLSRIFGKFERLGRSGDGGSGLGLYISRRLARAMKGELTVDSAPGQGARFTLMLPRAA